MAKTNFNANANSSSVNFRNKFAKMIDTPERLAYWTSAFQEFVSEYSPAEATEILFHLSVKGEHLFEDLCKDPDTLMKGMGTLTVDPKELLPNIPTAEILALIRNEARFQYEQIHKGFLNRCMDENTKAAFIQLKNHSDEIIAASVYDCCNEYMYVLNENIERVLYLLAHKDEKFFFGGLKTLGFNEEQANYLKPYHNYVHALMMAMYENKKNEFVNITTYEVAAPAPEAVSVKIAPTSHLPANPNTAVAKAMQKVKEEAPAAKKLRSPTPADIVKHPDFFTFCLENMETIEAVSKLDFDILLSLLKVMKEKNIGVEQLIATLSKLQEAEFAIQEVFAKREKIQKVLIALEEF